MDLIIKPTEKCNFSCTFCSSTQLVNDKNSILEVERIERFLERFPDTRTIIVNGGDPLMMPPSYYRKILNVIEERGLSTILSFTTNLWGFYKNPKMWIDIFTHPQVGVGTSFNYGETRRITPSQNFTEEIFWKVSNLFLQEIGYRPSFISVITDENEDRAIDNVYLAREMNVECKLNYALGSGRLSKPYLKGKIYKTYLDIIDLGLAPWEYNTKQLIKKADSKPTTCPVNRNCDSNIRNLQPEGGYYSCGAFGDDKEYPIDFETEMKSSVRALPLHESSEIQFLKEDCLTCPLFEICNGCKKNISDLKRNDMVDVHCLTMQKNLPRLEKYLCKNTHSTTITL